MPNLKHISVNGVTYDIPTGGGPILLKLKSGYFYVDPGTTTSDRIEKKLKVGDTIYMKMSAAGLRATTNGTTFSTNLKLTDANDEVFYTIGSGTFYAIVTAVATNLVTAKAIAIKERYTYRNGCYAETTYSATYWEDHIKQFYSYAPSDINTGLNPFILKSGSTTISPSSITRYNLYNGSFILLYQYTNSSAVTNAILHTSTNEVRHYDAFMYCSGNAILVINPATVGNQPWAPMTFPATAGGDVTTVNLNLAANGCMMIYGAYPKHNLINN